MPAAGPGIDGRAAGRGTGLTPVTTRIALIRGINVGTGNRVAMAALRDMLTGLGYQAVRTHLNSGNAIFDATGSPESVTTAVEQGLADRLGVPASVVVRSPAQIVAAMAADPLSSVATDGSKHFLGFLRAKPDSNVDQIPELADDADTAPDVVRLIDDHLYLWCPNGLLKASFSKVNWDRRLGTVVTMRNWNTVAKLVTLAAD